VAFCFFSETTKTLEYISKAIYCYEHSFRRLVMAKSKDVRKDVKKKPAKSIMEKRKAKQEKKSK
jgi:hypothetical protein